MRKVYTQLCIIYTCVFVCVLIETPVYRIDSVCFLHPLSSSSSSVVVMVVLSVILAIILKLTRFVALFCLTLLRTHTLAVYCSMYLIYPSIQINSEPTEHLSIHLSNRHPGIHTKAVHTRNCAAGQGYKQEMVPRYYIQLANTYMYVCLFVCLDVQCTLCVTYNIVSYRVA